MIGSRITVAALVTGIAVVDWRFGLAFALLNLKSQDEMQQALGRLMATGGAAAPPEVAYQLELASTTPPAKEVRVFGLGDWILGRYRTGMDQHMRGVWRRGATSRPA